MCCRLNPCCLCTAEIGLYILSLTNSMVLTAAVVVGVIQFHTAYPYFSSPEEDMPIYEKILYAAYLSLYTLYLLIEIGLREYLYKAMDLTRELKIRRCRRWIWSKVISVVLLGNPAIVLHLYLEMTSFKIIMYSLCSLYQYYYIWVVYHYTLEIEKEFRESSIITPSNNSTNPRKSLKRQENIEIQTA